MSPSDQAPRSKEPKRRDLERKFLAKTLKTKGAMIPKALKRRAQKLFKPKKDLATTDLARYKDDIERRQIILKLMKKLIKAGDELPHEEAKWQRLANVDQQAYAEKEEEDRAIIINELASRVFKPLEGLSAPAFVLRVLLRKHPADKCIAYSVANTRIPAGSQGGCSPIPRYPQAARPRRYTGE